MRLPFTHPTLAQLSAFVADELTPAEHKATAAHLATCATCQASLRFIHRVSEPAETLAAPADDALLSRIVASRAEGARVILPAAPQTSPSRRLHRAWGFAAALVAVVGVAKVFAPTDAMASGEDGLLTLSPAAPRAGSVVRVRYVPAANRFVGSTSLRLRSRVRTASDVSYSVPPSHLRVLDTLTRASGGAFEGTFTVPDSVVFAVFAVESLDSATVDDNTSRGWEMLVAASDGRPLFQALYQRANDMMGRSWEEGYASVTRATELYPDSITGWTFREFFERQLFAGAAGDSIRRTRSATIDGLITRARLASSLGYEAMGSIYYRVQSRARPTGATGVDSADLRYWWERLRREYPTHEQAAQHHAVWMDVNALGPSSALDSLDRLYTFYAPLRGPGFNVANVALQVARQANDGKRLRLWTERVASGSLDSTRRLAIFMAGRAEYRDEGVALLRTLLRDTTLGGSVARPIGRNAESHWRIVGDARRSIFAALGKALVAQGHVRAALDTLQRASDGGWDPALNRDMARTYAQAGDTAAALSMNARIVVDGRTAPSQRDSLELLGERQYGSAAWAKLVREARQDMYARLLERSLNRDVAPAARVRSRDGQARSLSELTDGKAALVIFWSRHCGYALEAVPEIAKLIEHLKVSNTPAIFVVDESQSAELDRELARHKITWPVFYDDRSSLADAMRNFGTPAYYVVDRSGRIRFTDVDQVADLYARLDAVAAESAAPR